jgi:protein arginine kinase
VNAADTVRQLADQPLPWIAANEKDPVIVNTRVRLARNLENVPFPNRLGITDRRKVRNQLTQAVAVAAPRLAAASFNLSDFNQLQLKLLRERSLTNRDHVRTRAGAGLAIDPSLQLSVLINEDDHVRVQLLSPGNDPVQAWRQLAEIDEDLREELSFARRARLGYCCAHPLNTGTGLRVSALMHLPALALADELDPVARAADALDFTVAGIQGRNSPPTGCVFQFATRSANAVSEEHLVANAERHFAEVQRLELQARQQLLETRPEILYDHVARAWAVLRAARLLDTEEATNYLMSLRLGVNLGTFSKLSLETINDLLVGIRPAHLQFRAGRPLNKFERDAERARIVRETLGADCAS